MNDYNENIKIELVLSNQSAPQQPHAGDFPPLRFGKRLMGGVGLPSMGYFEIGVYHPKTEMNIGTLWRSAIQLGASGVFTIGKRYHRQASDTYNTAANIPLRYYEDWEKFNSCRPYAAMLIGIEMGGVSLSTFIHPKSAVYLLGAEDNGLPKEITDKCQCLVSIESIRQPSFNVAVAGSIVMYHRLAFRQPNTAMQPNLLRSASQIG